MSEFEAGVAIRDISPSEDWFNVRRELLRRGRVGDGYGGYKTQSFTDGVAEPILART